MRMRRHRRLRFTRIVTGSLCDVRWPGQHIKWNILSSTQQSDWRSWLRHCASNRLVVGSVLDGVFWDFSLTKLFRPHFGPEVDSVSNIQGVSRL